jgi:hypothetical protein
MKDQRPKEISWTYLLAAGCALLPALVAGYFAWQAADAFLSEITSNAESLLFRFSLFFGFAIVLLNAPIIIMLLAFLLRKRTLPDTCANPSGASTPPGQ